jgi:uncharacterized protein YgiM (DUF1202 family)
MVFLAALAACYLPLSAQTTAPANAAPAAQAAAPDEVVGTVMASDVNVRSEANMTGSYVCTKIHKPAKITVLEISGEWLKILPTTGCYSVVAKEFVDADPSGKTGKIKTDHVWARTGGDLCAWTDVTKFWGVHLQLKAGATVEIIGATGNYYKITPPEGSYYWVNSRFVDLAGKTPAKVAPAAPEDNKISVHMEQGHESTTQETTEITPKTPAAPEPAPVVDNSTARGQFRLLEKEMKAEYAKPADQQDFKGLIAKYEAINVGDDDYLKKMIAARVKYFQTQLALSEEAKNQERLARESKEHQAEIDRKLQEITVRSNTPAATVYAADGVLMASSLFPGNEVTPKRYVVRDPDTNRITAYVQCTRGDVRLENYVGKHVGITGSTEYDRDLKLYIVEAKEVKILNADAKLPAAPEATVTPPPAKEAAPVETTPAKSAVQPTTKPAASAPTAPAAKTTAQPDFGDTESPAAPDATPKGVPAKTPTTVPATKPASNSKPLPPTGLKTADDR